MVAAPHYRSPTLLDVESDRLVVHAGKREFPFELANVEDVSFHEEWWRPLVYVRARPGTTSTWIRVTRGDDARSIARALSAAHATYAERAGTAARRVEQGVAIYRSAPAALPGAPAPPAPFQAWGLTWTVLGLLLVVCPPIGLVLLWLVPGPSARIGVLLSIVSAVIGLLAMGWLG